MPKKKPVAKKKTEDEEADEFAEQGDEVEPADVDLDNLEIEGKNSTEEDI